MHSSSFINKYFIHPLPDLGLDTYVIRKSIMRAVSDLQTKIRGNVVDLGCGIMPYKAFLKEGNQINNYIGIDLENSEYHNTEKPDKFWDGFTIPIEDNSQDWVIVTEFLEHYFDTGHILKEIKRILKPGGKIFFTVPCVYMLHEVPYDHHRFTPFSLKEYFKIAAYSKAEVFPLGGFNYSLIIMMSLWSRHSGTRGWVRIAAKYFLLLFHKQLLKEDHFYGTYTKGFTNYENFTFPSGLWGYAEK